MVGRVCLQRRVGKVRGKGKKKGRDFPAYGIVPSSLILSGNSLRTHSEVCFTNLLGTSQSG
jgi:hypothetical protein